MKKESILYFSVNLIALIFATSIQIKSQSNIEIGGTVWYDEIINLEYDVEPGLSELKVFLYYADDLESVLDSTITNSDGFYKFNVNYGIYSIIFDMHPYLLCGASINPNSNLDHDNNGIEFDIPSTGFDKIIIDSIFISSNTISPNYTYDVCLTFGDCIELFDMSNSIYQECSQMDNPSIFTCDITELDNLCFQNEDAPNSINFGCESGSIDSPIWFEFIAGKGEIDIHISPNSLTSDTLPCTIMTGQLGMQAALYDNPLQQDPIWCQGICKRGQISTKYFELNLVGGCKYYLVVDGCGGFICPFKLSISKNVEYIPAHEIQNIPINIEQRYDDEKLSIFESLTFSLQEYKTFAL